MFPLSEVSGGGGTVYKKLITQLEVERSLVRFFLFLSCYSFCLCRTFEPIYSVFLFKRVFEFICYSAFALTSRNMQLFDIAKRSGSRK